MGKQTGVVGAAGLAVGGALGLAASPLNVFALSLSANGATLIGAALGAAFSVAAALGAIRHAQVAEQKQLREFVRLSFEDVIAASAAIGNMQLDFTDEPEGALSVEGWSNFRKLGVELAEACEKASARLKRIDAMAYKMDSSSMRLLLQLEDFLPEGRSIAKAIQSHANSEGVRWYGGAMPRHLGEALGYFEGVFKGLNIHFAR
jgi:hypothetical protein